MDTVVITGTTGFAYSGGFGGYQDFYSVVGGPTKPRSGTSGIALPPPKKAPKPPPSTAAPVLPDAPPDAPAPPETPAPQPEPVVTVTAPRDQVVPIIERPADFGAAALPLVTVYGSRPQPAPKPPRRRAPPRRTKPARRGRPLRRPAVRPRLPIVLPPLLARAVPIAAFAATMLPIMYDVATKLDDAATTAWQNQLGVAPSDRRDEQLGPDNAARLAAGPTTAPGGMPEVVVTARRPRIESPPRPVGTPFSVAAPSLLPVGVGWMANPVGGDALPAPRSRTRPKRDPRPSFSVGPEYVTNARPYPIPSAPFSPLVDLPTRAPAPAPSPAPSAPPFLNPFVDDLVQQPLPGTVPDQVPKPYPSPSPFPEPQAEPNPDRCRCPKSKAPKKKRSKRTVCSSGSYKQTASGLSKHATKYFDCATGAERPAPSKPKSVATKAIDAVRRKLPKYKLPYGNKNLPFPHL